MALVSMHTRLMGLLSEAQFVSQYCSQASAAMAAGPVSANQVVGMAQRFQASVVNVAKAAQSDLTFPGLVTYAANQFAGQAWTPLDTQVSGIITLLQNVINKCIAAIPTDAGGFIQKDKFNADGSVTVAVLAPAQTAGIVTACNAVVAAIPT